MNIVNIKPDDTKYSRSAFNNPNSKPAKLTEGLTSVNSNAVYTSISLLNHKAYNYNIISFKNNDNQDLLSNFSASGSSSEIYKFLCDAKNTNPIQVRKFLDYVLKNDELATRFISEITKNPRKSAEIVINLTNKLGGEDEFRDWYFASGGYRESFGKYIGNYYSRAKNIDELLTLRPNWKLSDITETYNKTARGNPLIGVLPQELASNPADFATLVNALKAYKDKKHNEIYINSRRIKYEVLKDAADKLVCKVTAIDKNKDFIVKIDKIYNDFTFSRLRANSIYLEAIMGRYLSIHNCKDVPKFHYYDFFHNASLFDYNPGKSFDKEFNPIKMNQLTPDLLALGIRTNDTHISNYLQTNDGVVNIDLGNASYFDALKPGDLAHTIFFPNYTGLDFSNSYNVLEFAKFIEKSQK